MVLARSKGNQGLSRAPACQVLGIHFSHLISAPIVGGRYYYSQITGGSIKPWLSVHSLQRAALV